MRQAARGSPRHVAARTPSTRRRSARWASVSRTGHAASHLSSRSAPSVGLPPAPPAAPFGATNAPEFAPGPEETALFPAEIEESSVPSSPTSAFRVVSQESASSRTTSPPIRRACAFVDGLRLRRSQSAPEFAPHVSERRTQPPRPTGAGANGCGLRREGEVERFIWVETTGSVPMPPAARASLRLGLAVHPAHAVVP